MSSIMMKALDKDSSGTASLDEFEAVGKSLPGGSVDQSDEALSKAFSSLDSDSDGSLTESEVATGLAKFSQESAGALLGQQEAGGRHGGKDLIENADSDGSGTVSLAEFTAAGPKSASTDQAESLFSKIDSDGDGEITETEDETFRSSQEAAHAGPPPGAPPAGGARSSTSTDDDDDDDDTASTIEAQLSQLLSELSSGKTEDEGIFDKADTDKSGTVSLAELTAAGPKSASSDQAESLFSKIDSDGDGEITKTEDEAFQSSQEAKGPPPQFAAGGADTSSSSTDDDDDDDTTSTLTLSQQFSELLSARSAYSSSTVSSYLDAAASSLFSASA